MLIVAAARRHIELRYGSHATQKMLIVAEWLSIQKIKISAQQPDGGRGKSEARPLDALIFSKGLLPM